MAEDKKKRNPASQAKGGGNKEQEVRREPGTSRLEWIAAALGLAMLVLLLGYLAFDALSKAEGPAQLEVEALGISPGRGGYIVEFSVTNRAGLSAAAVEIAAELRDGDRVIEESNVTVDYVPQQSERKGALMFQNDPRAHDLRLLARGYSEP